MISAACEKYVWVGRWRRALSKTQDISHAGAYVNLQPGIITPGVGGTKPRRALPRAVMVPVTYAQSVWGT